MQLEIAKLMFQIGAVCYREDPPFRFTSEVLSPVYIDCRLPISHLAVRNRLIELALQSLASRDFDVIAGGETAGIPYAAIVADRLHKPLVYVRKHPKGFGRKLLIEGEFNKGQRLILIEDLTFDGQTKIRFCEAIRDAGGRIDTAFSIFNYGIAECEERLSAASIELLYLCGWDAVLNVASRDGEWTEEQCSSVRSFLGNPESWTANRNREVRPISDQTMGLSSQRG